VVVVVVVGGAGLAARTHLAPKRRPTAHQGVNCTVGGFFEVVVCEHVEPDSRQPGSQRYTVVRRGGASSTQLVPDRRPAAQE